MQDLWLNPIRPPLAKNYLETIDIHIILSSWHRVRGTVDVVLIKLNRGDLY